MSTRRDLGTVLLRGTLAVALLAIVGTGILWLVHTYVVYRQDVGRLREDGLIERRMLVRGEVERAVDLIEATQASTEVRMKALLKQHVESARELAARLHDLEAERLGDVEVRRLVVEALRTIRFRGGRGYFFATTLDGRAELWPTHPHLEGENVLDVVDSDGRTIVKDLAEIVRTKGAGFYEHRMKKPGEPGDRHPKLSYVVRFEPLDWYIGAGEYLEDFEKELQLDVLGQLKEQFIPHSAYIFVGTWDGLSLLGPARGTNLLEDGEPGARDVVRRLIERARDDGGFVEYDMPALDGQRSAPKLSYVKGVPGWKWYIGAGVYLDEIEAEVAEREDRLRGQLRTQIGIILVALVLVSLVAVLISRRIASRTRRDIDRFGAFVAEAADGPASVDSGIFQLDELASLAATGNAMVFARDRALETVERQRKRQTALAEISSFLANAPTDVIDERVRDSLSMVVIELGIENCCVWRFRDESGVRTHTCLEDGRSEGSEDLAPFLETLRRGESVVRNDTRVLPDDAPASEAAHHARRGLKSFAAIPLRRAGAVVGSLHVAATESARRWTGEDLVWLQAVGRAISGAIDRLEGHEALVRSEKRLRDLVEYAPVPMSQSTQDGRILLVNARFTEVFGYTLDDLPDLEAWWRLAYPDPGYRREVRDDWTRRVETADREGTGIPSGEFRVTRRDGLVRTVILTGAVVGDRLVVVFDDVTDQRLVQEQLRQSQKLESIGQLAGGIAHDFNNQLTGILGHTEVLRGRLSKEEDRRILDHVLTATSRAAELTAQLLAFARKGQYRNEPVDLHGSIREAVTILGRTIDKRIEIRQSLRAAHRWCTGDPAQIQSAMLNLGLNARDAMPEGGRLTFETTDRVLAEEPGPDASGSLPAGPYVEIRVSDTGTGIGADVLPHIFDPFFTTKPEGEGTGMGLSATYGTVRRHGGEVRVESEPGRGTTFTVLLPRGESPEDPGDDAKGESAGPDRRRILVIDDEDLVRESIGAMLEALGHEVVLRADGASGLQTAVGDDRFDLVLLDLTMPGLAGPEVFEFLCDRVPDLPVLIMSGHSVDGVAQGLLDRGAVGFVQKPCSLADLEGAVARVSLGP